MSSLLSEPERRTIEQRIADVEAHTAGEIVVHVVDRSDGYGLPRLFFAVIFGGASAEVLSYEMSELLGGWSLELAAGIGLVTWLLLGLDSVLRIFVPRVLAEAQVHRRALQAFVENRVHRTRDASGVLILVSALEQRVEILADEGIHARVGVDGWTRHVATIVAGLKKKRAAEGLLEAIDGIGSELRAGFPPREDDENELSNQVVITAR